MDRALLLISFPTRRGDSYGGRGGGGGGRGRGGGGGYRKDGPPADAGGADGKDDGIAVDVDPCVVRDWDAPLQARSRSPLC